MSCLRTFHQRLGPRFSSIISCKVCAVLRLNLWSIFVGLIKHINYSAKLFNYLFCLWSFLLLQRLSLFYWISFCILHLWLFYIFRILIVCHTKWVLKVSSLYLWEAISSFIVPFYWTKCLSLHKYHIILITVVI